MLDDAFLSPRPAGFFTRDQIPAIAFFCAFSLMVGFERREKLSVLSDLLLSVPLKLLHQSVEIFTVVEVLLF